MQVDESNLIAAVVRKTSAVFGVPVTAILSKSRSAPIVRARHAAMHVLHLHFGQTVSTIGVFFDRDHASVSHAHRTIKHHLLHGPAEERRRLALRIEKIKATKDPDVTPAEQAEHEQQMLMTAFGEEWAEELVEVFKEIKLLLRSVREGKRAKMRGDGKKDEVRTLEARSSHHHKPNV